MTFLFSDVEGSTRLLAEVGSAQYERLLQDRRREARRAFTAHRGVEVDTQGDAFFVAFPGAADAVAAAALLAESDGPLRVRVGIHTGEPLLTDAGYVGMDVHRAARIAAAAHGGQVVVSTATRELVSEVELRDLGEHRLKDLSRPEHLYQLGSDDFPPLRSLYRTNLPLVSWPLVGRDAELAEIVSLVESGRRLVTLTGAGGSGKTRLALQAAAELSDSFPGGTFFVSLAQLQAIDAVPNAIATSLGLRPGDDPFETLGDRRALIALDNAEHLLGIASVVSELLEAATRTVVLVTSRAPLHLAAEREFAVEPLTVEDACAFFVARATAVGRPLSPDATVKAICARVDNLPLAVELAAARAKMLSPPALLARLDRALPVLTTGFQDSPERQRTLRATIAWSYELLGESERRVFRALGVFRGGASLAAAEHVAGADLDALAELVDQSLLKASGEDRFLMLETIREYALERLHESNEGEEVASRHRQWYVDRLLENASHLRGPRTAELLAWYELESANTWLALDQLLGEDRDAALLMADELVPYWIARAQMREGRRWLETALQSSSDSPSLGRARGLARLADLASRLGDLQDAESLAEQAAAVATEVADDVALCRAFYELSWNRRLQGRYDEAVSYAAKGVSAAERAGSPALVAHVQGALAAALTRLGRLEEARAIHQSRLGWFKSIGDEINTANVYINLTSVAVAQHQYDNVRELSTRALDILRELEEETGQAFSLLIRGYAALFSDDAAAALEDSAQALTLALKIGASLEVLTCLGQIAAACRATDPAAAVSLWAASLARLHEHGHEPDESFFELGRAMIDPLETAIGDEAFRHAQNEGAALPEDEAIDLAFELARRAEAKPQESGHRRTAP